MDLRACHGRMAGFPERTMKYVVLISIFMGGTFQGSTERGSFDDLPKCNEGLRYLMLNMKQNNKYVYRMDCVMKNPR